MTFDKLKNSSFGKWVYDKRLYFLIFAIPFGIMYLTYAVFGVHPFGDNSVLVLDLNGQYVYYYEAFRDAIWGDKSLIYSWSRNLSGEMFGIFGYYLASPFMLIVVLLPRTWMLGAIELMELCKVGACAVTFAVFYKKTRNPRSDIALILFSTTYALMTYTVVELMNPMWIDGLIYLPLILLGVEKLVDTGKMTSFIIPLTLMFIAHFYIGYMVGFFTAIYFMYYCFSRIGYKVVPNFKKSCVKFFVSVVVAVLTACIVLIPVYNSLKLGKFDFSDPDFSLRSQFTFLDFFTKIFTFSYDTVLPDGLPFVSCGTMTLLLVPLFFLNKKINIKEKVSSAILLTTVFASMYFSTIDIAWHGFQVPNWLPFRYSFCFSFVMIIMAFRAFENIEGVSLKDIGCTFFGFVVLLFLLEKENYEYFAPVGGIWVSFLCLSIFCAVLYLLRKRGTKAMVLAALVVVCGEIFANSIYTVVCVDYNVVYSKYSSYQQYMIDGREIVSQIEDLDDGLYRSEKTFHRTVNDAIGMGLKGVSHSSSTLNTPVLKLLQKLGFTYGGHYTKYTGNTLITDALLGIKYVLNKDKEMYPYYDLIMDEGTTGVSDIEVWENPYALSVGFMANKNIMDFNMDEYDNPFLFQSHLLDTLVTGKTNSFYMTRLMPTKFDTENISIASAGGHTKYTPINPNLNAHLEFTLKASSDAPIYMFFPSEYRRKMNVWVNKEFLSFYYEGEDYCILKIGNFKKDDVISVITTITEECAYIRETWFYTIDMEGFEDAIAKLKEGEWKISEHTDTYIKGTVTAQEDQVFFTTIPYEPGWTVLVDGKEVEYSKALNSLIAFPLEAGEHTVEMKFFPDYFKTAILVSLCGLILLVFIALLEYKDGLLIKKLISKKKKTLKVDEKKIN